MFLFVVTVLVKKYSTFQQNFSMIKSLSKKENKLQGVTLKQKSCFQVLKLFTLNHYNRWFKCMENKEDKEQLKVIQKEEERLEEIFDLKMILKNVNRINFFQKIVLKKLGIKYEDVQ